MTSVIVDKDQAEAMVKTGELVEVRNQAGEVIGFFAPVKTEYAKEYSEAAARYYSTWGPGGMPRHLKTPEEVFAYLEAREKAG